MKLSDDSGPGAPPFRAFAAGAALVALTYVHFLLFAQFALLALARAAAPAGGDPRALLAAEGAGGLVGSVLAVAFFSLARARVLLVTGFVAGALAAAVAPTLDTFATLATVGGLTGLAVGFTTVTLAATLRSTTGGVGLGPACGLGTGVAYALAAAPPFFTGSPALQCHVAAGAAALAAVVAASLPTQRQPERTAAGRDYGFGGTIAWVSVFFALVALDSVAFAVIQETPSLKAATWSGAGRQWLVTGVHMVGGLVAGFWLARGWSGRNAATALALLAVAVAATRLAPAGWVSVVYVAGVSLYSAALVHYASASARAGLAALVFIVAGWGGSALGLGLAEGRTEIPWWLLAATGGLAAAALVIVARPKPDLAKS